MYLCTYLVCNKIFTHCQINPIYKTETKQIPNNLYKIISSKIYIHVDKWQQQNSVKAIKIRARNAVHMI